MLTNPVFTFFIGVIFGVIMMCLMNIAKDTDRKINEMRKQLKEDNKNVRTNK